MAASACRWKAIKIGRRDGTYHITAPGRVDIAVSGCSASKRVFGVPPSGTAAAAPSTPTKAV